jgi:DNA replication ATP-dependent helicase Dna2
VHQLATALTSSGIPQGDIAVITPYRQQIKLLSNRLGQSMPGIEILTADKSQGRDKDCIIISLVRSNNTGNVSSLALSLRLDPVELTIRLENCYGIGGGSMFHSLGQRRNWSSLDRQVRWIAINSLNCFWISWRKRTGSCD